jgi:hypothetical protein
MSDVCNLWQNDIFLDQTRVDFRLCHTIHQINHPKRKGLYVSQNVPCFQSKIATPKMAVTTGTATASNSKEFFFVVVENLKSSCRTHQKCEALKKPQGHVEEDIDECCFLSSSIHQKMKPLTSTTSVMNLESLVEVDGSVSFQTPDILTDGSLGAETNLKRQPQAHRPRRR